MRILKSHQASSAIQSSQRRPQQGFTVTELCVVVAALACLGVVIFPALANSKIDSERVLCFNNLRIVGRGLNEFKATHGGTVPWRTYQSNGGTLPDSGSKPGAAWREFRMLSNSLPSPRVLTCPSDSGVRVATEFGNTASGYIGNSMQSQATSYTIGLEVTPDDPRDWVSGDRNLRPDGVGISRCSARIDNAAVVAVAPKSLPWTNGVHGPNFGHLSFNDGSVVFNSTAELRPTIAASAENGVVHFLPAR